MSIVYFIYILELLHLFLRNFHRIFVPNYSIVYYFSEVNNTDTCYSSESDAAGKPGPFQDLISEIRNKKQDQAYKVELPAGLYCVVKYYIQFTCFI